MSTYTGGCVCMCSRAAAPSCAPANPTPHPTTTQPSCVVQMCGGGYPNMCGGGYPNIFRQPQSPCDTWRLCTPSRQPTFPFSCNIVSP